MELVARAERLLGAPAVYGRETRHVPPPRGVACRVGSARRAGAAWSNPSRRSRLTSQQRRRHEALLARGARHNILALP
ncbi:MAG TPA: hypothetical protein VFQ61_05835, partial [Polyangiaceae bacterium]|nr:hypothetical protein [Polyangiaceae bacterium]